MVEFTGELFMYQLLFQHRKSSHFFILHYFNIFSVSFFLIRPQLYFNISAGDYFTVLCKWVFQENRRSGNIAAKNRFTYNFGYFTSQPETSLLANISKKVTSCKVTQNRSLQYPCQEQMFGKTGNLFYWLESMIFFNSLCRALIERFFCYKCYVLI